VLKKAHHTKFKRNRRVGDQSGRRPQAFGPGCARHGGFAQRAGKSVRVLVIAGGEKFVKRRKPARISLAARNRAENHGRMTDYDAVIRHAGHMRRPESWQSARPRGLMPNRDRDGDFRSRQGDQGSEGRAKWNSEWKSRNCSLPIGNIQFDGAKLAENAHAVIEAVVKAKPAAAKGST